MLTVDTSVFVNGYDTNEPGNETSRAFLNVVRGQQLALLQPELVVVEVAGALAHTRGDTTAAEVFALSLRSVTHFTFVALDESLASEALALAAMHRLRGADAIYAAVALRHDTTLVSLDREHLTRLSSVLRVLTPAEALAELSSTSVPNAEA